jgi:hypothetical protein
MKQQSCYKYCITYKRQCSKARKNGYCSNKERERCVSSERASKYALKVLNYM